MSGEHALSLSEHLREIADRLQTLADGEDIALQGSRTLPNYGTVELDSSSTNHRKISHFADEGWLLTQAQKLYAERRLREKFIASHHFGEPSWDMLLDLAIQSMIGRPVSVNSACIASAVAPTTALRWMAILEKEGLIVRKPGISDRRVNWVSLTPKGASLVKRYIIALNSNPKPSTPELMLIRGLDGEG